MNLFSKIASAFGGSAQQATIAPVTNGEQHDDYYKTANTLITPYIHIHGAASKPANTSKAQADLIRGIGLYQALLAYNPSNWSAWWMLGKAYQRLNDHINACSAFEKSFTIQKGNPDVAREYMFECLETGKFKEAVSAAEHAITISQKDAGLYANLALAYIFPGRITEAQAAITRSLEIDGQDPISLSVRRVVQEIATGKRRQPQTMRELKGR